MHRIRLTRPAPPLREYVRYYAQREVQIHEGAMVHPIPARAAPLIEFIVGDRIQVMYFDRSDVEVSPRVVIVGVQTHSRGQLQLQGKIECFVILFQPTGLHRLFSIPMHELTDHAYDGRSVLGPLVSPLEQRLNDCRTFAERVHIADEFLLRRSLAARVFDRVSAAAKRLLSGAGDGRIDDLAHCAGVSVRQFERSFNQQVGVRPKLYARIARFEAALDSKTRSPAKSWTDVAHEFGYHDQMHMVHDFESFTGKTPTHTLSQMEVLFQNQIAAMRAGRLPAKVSADSRLIL